MHQCIYTIRDKIYVFEMSWWLGQRRSCSMKRIFIILAVFFLCSGCGISSHDHNPSYEVEYVLTGTDTDTTSVNYYDENGLSVLNKIVSIPWSYSFTAQKGAFLSVSAQPPEPPGTLTLELYVNGELRESRFSGPASYTSMDIWVNL
jgi:hypothetical protein